MKLLHNYKIVKFVSRFIQASKGRNDSARIGEGIPSQLTRHTRFMEIVCYYVSLITGSLKSYIQFVL